MLRRNMNNSFETNFFAYRDTIRYLLEQNNPLSTWTICTGASGDYALRPLPGMTQGPLFTLSTAAARENESTNVRFNEIYLALRLEVDENAVKHGVTKASDFSNVYRLILDSPEVRSSRIRVEGVDDIRKLRHEKKNQPCLLILLADCGMNLIEKSV